MGFISVFGAACCLALLAKIEIGSLPRGFQTVRSVINLPTKKPESCKGPDVGRYGEASGECYVKHVKLRIALCISSQAVGPLDRPCEPTFIQVAIPSGDA